MTETDAHNEWLDWLWGRIKPSFDHFTISMTKAEWERLFALARRGADAAARIEELEKRVKIEQLTRDSILGSELKHWADKHKAQASRIEQLEAEVKKYAMDALLAARRASPASSQRP